MTGLVDRCSVGAEIGTLQTSYDFGITMVVMTKRLTRVGNSQALVIDKPILDLLGITMETDLEITTDGKGLHIVPVTEPDRRRRVKAAADHVMTKHRKTFEKLAK